MALKKLRYLGRRLTGRPLSKKTMDRMDAARQKKASKDAWVRVGLGKGQRVSPGNEGKNLYETRRVIRVGPIKVITDKSYGEDGRIWGRPWTRFKVRRKGHWVPLKRRARE
ncbi:MAG: hypothetical protein NT067_05800 [Candidatus Diapherotrites archaeon]|nr:hypothetical protein [Candidatus Diapherotrites archaeon]